MTTTGQSDDVDVDVCCVKMQTQPTLIARARALLTADEHQRADRFRTPRLRGEFALGRATLRLLLSHVVGMSPVDLRFTYGPHGKPALVGGAASSVQFNASHSGDLFGFAVVRGRAIGVDVEQHRQVLDYERIALRFFSATERRDLMSVPHATRPSAFFDCWTRKEAFVKALGGGLSIPLDSFGVSLMPKQPAALLDVAGSAAEASAWTIHAFLPAPGFSGAVALRYSRPRVYVRHVDVQDVFVGAGLL